MFQKQFSEPCIGGQLAGHSTTVQHNLTSGKVKSESEEGEGVS